MSRTMTISLEPSVKRALPTILSHVLGVARGQELHCFGVTLGVRLRPSRCTSSPKWSHGGADVLDGCPRLGKLELISSLDLVAMAGAFEFLWGFCGLGCP